MIQAAIDHKLRIEIASIGSQEWVNSPLESTLRALRGMANGAANEHYNMLSNESDAGWPSLGDLQGDREPTKELVGAIFRDGHDDSRIHAAVVLQFYRELREWLKRDMERIVYVLRVGGFSWEKIGNLLGVSRQAVHDRYSGDMANYIEQLKGELLDELLNDEEFVQEYTRRMEVDD